MKKLALDMDALRVETFATTRAVSTLRGTVRGNDYTGDDCYRITQDAACGPFTTQQPGPEPSAGGTCALSICIPLTEPNAN